MEDLCDIKRVLESQGNMHNKVKVQSNSESRSLALSPTHCPEPPCLQIDV
jgi:Fe-S-cluster-containing hydrogenase component 2